MAALDDLKNLLTALDATESAATLGDALSEERKKARAQARAALEAALREVGAVTGRISADLNGRDARWTATLRRYEADKLKVDTALTETELAPATVSALVGDIAALPGANGKTVAQLNALTSLSDYDALTARLLAAAEDESGETVDPSNAAELRTLKALKTTLDLRRAALDVALAALAAKEKEGEGLGAAGSSAVKDATLALETSRASVAQGQAVSALHHYLEGRAARATAAGLPTPATLNTARGSLRATVLTAQESWAAALEDYLDAKGVALQSAAQGRARARARDEGIEAALLAAVNAP